MASYLLNGLPCAALALAFAGTYARRLAAHHADIRATLARWQALDDEPIHADMLRWPTRATEA